MNDERSVALYRQHSDAETKRLDEVSAVEDISSNRQEIALLRVLIERLLAEDKPNVSMINSLMQTLQKAQKAELHRMVKVSDWVVKPRLRLFIDEIVSILASTCNVHFKDGEWEPFLSDFSTKLDSAFAVLANSDGDVTQLKLPR